MPWTLEQVRTAYQNAAAAGDTQSAEALLRHAQSLAMAQAPQESYSPTEGNSFAQNAQEGVGRGLTNVARHAGNLVGLYPDEKLAEAKQLDEPLMNTGGGQAGSLLGEIAATAPLGAFGAGIGRAGAVGARIAGSPIARGVLEGAAQGAIMSDPGQRAEGALLSGALGAALPGAQALGGKAMRGVNKTPEAEALIRQGVDLTPGQMNPHGMYNQIEESWQSVPFIGPIIKNSRDNAVGDWQRAVVQQGAPAGTQIARGNGDEMLDAAYQAFEPAYAPGKGFPVGAKTMRTQGGDVPLTQGFAQAGNKPRLGMSPDQRANDVEWANEQLGEMIGQARRSGNGLTSDDLLNFRSMIRTEARSLNAADPAGKARRELLQDMERRITEALDSQLPPEAMGAVRAADKQYGQYKVVENAMARTGDQAAGLTPAKLSQAVKASTDERAYARGAGGPLRDLAQQGGAAFEKVSPPTGARLAAWGVPAAAMAASPSIGIPLAAGTLGLTATRTGRKIAGGNTAMQQRAQALVEAMRTQVPEPYRELANAYAQRLIASGGY